MVLEQNNNEKDLIFNHVIENCFAAERIDLSLSWDSLKKFKQVPGIYRFSLENDSYIGSTKDIYSRCFIQHKNQAFTSKNKHKKFYSLVGKNGWNKFTLTILKVTSNHVNKFY